MELSPSSPPLVHLTQASHQFIKGVISSLKVEVLDTNELQLVVGSGGDASYQHICREARGVYWDNDVGAFRGAEQTEWTFAEWFAHIGTCG